MINDLFDEDEPSPPQGTLSVSELNRKVKDLLAIHFPLIWVEGEISNLSRPASGHWYFTLKDANAQVSCAMFKRRNAGVKFSPKVGDHLKVRASVSLYEGRGDYQLIVEHMEQAGFGLLQKRFEELKAKLHDEGLFDPEEKQALPSHIRHLAVVTSPTGAAIRDVLSVLKRRFPALPVTIVPSPVQGDEAPAQLIRALHTADACDRYDAILLCRGGGSIEDLWAFNNEALARTIYDCEKPVVCAVGHEIDFSIADFVADLRAPTPSAAAELLSPNGEEILERMTLWQRQMQRLVLQRLHKETAHVQSLFKQLKHPRDTLAQWHQNLDHIESRLNQALKRLLESQRKRVEYVDQRLKQAPLTRSISLQQRHTQDLNRHLKRAIQQRLQRTQQNITLLVAQLDLVSPLAVLKRGYSITHDSQQRVLRNSQHATVGENISIRLAKGQLDATVTSIKTAAIQPGKED